MIRREISVVMRNGQSINANSCIIVNMKDKLLSGEYKISMNGNILYMFPQFIADKRFKDIEKISKEIEEMEGVIKAVYGD